jgi:hypothetical protein
MDQNALWGEVPAKLSKTGEIVIPGKRSKTRKDGINAFCRSLGWIEYIKKGIGCQGPFGKVLLAKRTCRTWNEGDSQFFLTYFFLNELNCNSPG